MHDWERREADLADVAFGELGEVLAGLQQSGWEVESVSRRDGSGRLVATLRRRVPMPEIGRRLAG